MKKILALAAAAALAAGASAYAANPFSDVSTSDWAYQAVSDLSRQGIVEGYPDGTFKGETNITRYELAQIVARLMAKEDQYSAEQRATIDKLAGEYADELASLGVRVGSLEKKVGNITWTGDARMRYQDLNGKDGVYQGRIRLNVKGQVNDSTYVQGRLVSTADLKNGDDAKTTADRIIVHYDFGDAFGITMGRYEVDMGQQGTWLYANAFDGIEAQAKLGDKVGLKVGYGRFKDAQKAAKDFGHAEAFYVQAKADLGAAKLGVDYYKTAKYTGSDGDQVWGANLLIPVGDFRVFGDYYQNTDAKGDPQIWTAGIGYGKVNYKKPGTFKLDVGYFDVEEGLYHKGMKGWQLGDSLFSEAGTFFFANGEVTLAKNVYVHGEYAFAHDADNGKDLDDEWTLSLNYKF